MKKIILKNVLMNLFFTIFFITLNNWLLQNGFEETFISLALIYGIIVVIANAFFVAKLCKK